MTDSAHTPAQTPLSDLVSAALSKMVSGEWRLILEHPEPSHGTSLCGFEVGKEIARRALSAVGGEAVAWQSCGPNGYWGMDAEAADPEFRKKNEALGFRFRPLYASPQPANPAQVTDALEAFLGQTPRRHIDDLYFQNGIRRSDIERRLTAAIGAGACAANEALADIASIGSGGRIDWKSAFAAQTRKLQAALHIPGVKEVLAELKWPDPAIGAGGQAVAGIADHKWLDPECGVNGCQSLVWKSRYESAVKGRADFRQAYRGARAGEATIVSLLKDMLSYLEGGYPNVTSGGQKNADLRDRILSALSQPHPADEPPAGTMHPLGPKQTIISEVWEQLERSLCRNVDRSIVEQGVATALHVLRREGVTLQPHPADERVVEARGLVEFAKEMCRIGFDGGSIDGCDILDTAVEHGLCHVTQYRKGMADIANAEYLEEGDAVYVFTTVLSAKEGR